MSLLLSALLVACGGAPPVAPPSTGPTLLRDGDVVVVHSGPIATGPRVAGTLEAADRAVIRAEAAGSVEEVSAEVGDSVSRGAVLARIEAGVAMQARTSASSGVVAAEQDVLIAEREAERAQRLVEVGALAERDREMAQSALVAARARLLDARARLATQSQQLDGTVVRSPLDGVVAARAVNLGDIVSPGAPLFTVLEPSSLRLQGSVSAEAVGLLKPGTPVQFAVQGFPDRRFAGVVERVAPEVDAVTRQVPVLVTIPNDGGPLVAGLFAEGRLAAETREGFLLPADALLPGAEPRVRVVRDGAVAEVPVELGLRDADLEQIEVRSGLSEGDTVLVGPARSVAVGARVSLPTPPAVAAGG